VITILGRCRTASGQISPVSGPDRTRCRSGLEKQQGRVRRIGGCDLAQSQLRQVWSAAVAGVVFKTRNATGFRDGCHNGDLGATIRQAGPDGQRQAEVVGYCCGNNGGWLSWKCERFRHW